MLRELFADVFLNSQPLSMLTGVGLELSHTTTQRRLDVKLSSTPGKLDNVMTRAHTRLTRPPRRVRRGAIIQAE